MDWFWLCLIGLYRKSGYYPFKVERVNRTLPQVSFDYSFSSLSGQYWSDRSNGTRSQSWKEQIKYGSKTRLMSRFLRKEKVSDSSFVCYRNKQTRERNTWEEGSEVIPLRCEGSDRTMSYGCWFLASSLALSLTRAMDSDRRSGISRFGLSVPGVRELVRSIGKSSVR